MGRAVDIKIEGMTGAEIASAAEKVYHFQRGGIGTYETFVHLDVRTEGPARWKG